MKRYQFVWWGWATALDSSSPFFDFVRDPSARAPVLWSHVYAWSLWLGPLEIRRWRIS